MSAATLLGFAGVALLCVATMAAYAAAGERTTRGSNAASARAWIDRGCGAMLLLLATGLAVMRGPLATA